MLVIPTSQSLWCKVDFDPPAKIYRFGISTCIYYLFGFQKGETKLSNNMERIETHFVTGYCRSY